MKHYLGSASLAIIALLATPPDFAGKIVPSFLATLNTAQAQSAVTVSKISIVTTGMTLTIPQMNVEGSSASEADIRAMFDPKGIDQLATRFRAFSARAVTIPEIQLLQKLPDGSETTTIYRDSVLRDIKNGIIGEAQIRESVTKTAVAKPAAGKKVTKPENPPFALDMTMADTRYKGLNISLMARFLTDKAAPGEKLEMALVEQRIGKTVMSFGKGSVTINQILGTDFKLKPLSKPLMQTLAEMEADQNKKTDMPEKEAIQFFVDLMSSISFGNLELNGLTGTIPTEDSKQGLFSIEKIRMAGGDSAGGVVAMQDFKLNISQGTASIGEFAVKGIRYPGLTEIQRQLDAGTNKTDIKIDNLVPTIEQFRLAAIDVDIPDSKDKTKKMKGKLGAFDIKMGNHIGPIPANIAILFDKAQMDIPTDTKEKSLKDILALGYKALDVSMRYDQVFDQASKVLKLNELSLSSAGMFAANAKAELTNVSKDIFTTDKAVASVALLGVMAKSVSVAVKNDSLFEKLIAQQASTQKRKVDDVRAELAAGATLMVPLFLGDHPGAQALGAALGKFLADPKNLKVDLAAKGNGVGAVDFLAVKNPIEILKKVDITASANQ